MSLPSINCAVPSSTSASSNNKEDAQVLKILQREETIKNVYTSKLKIKQKRN